MKLGHTPEKEKLKALVILKLSYQSISVDAFKAEFLKSSHIKGHCAVTEGSRVLGRAPKV